METDPRECEATGHLVPRRRSARRNGRRGLPPAAGRSGRAGSCPLSTSLIPRASSPVRA